ncbi:MAG: DUF362 domain-containing protein [Opitutaceae bacterium]|nr:DUF362 domain-containing protein [Opitutaceae bacterium]
MANSDKKTFRRRAWLMIAGVACGLVATALPGPVYAEKSAASLARRLPPPSNRLFQARVAEFGAESYRVAVEALVEAFEARTGKKLALGKRGRVGLKVYSDSGAGLGTPLDLTRGLLTALEARGIPRDRVTIVGLSEAHLRDAGYLPPLSVGGDHFEGAKVIALDSGAYWEQGWFYDSPLPGTDDSPLNEAAINIERSKTAIELEAERRSFLPIPLMFDVDFWINLPVCSDHPVVGVNAALVNFTLWNASNTQRFFRSPASAPAAVAEMAAIPELREGLVFHLVSLERYQFIGGPIFNSLYTVSEPLVWLSDNPVMIDALLRDRIDRGRENTGFRGLPEDLRLIPYAEQLGLGSGNPERIEWVEVALPASVATGPAATARVDGVP